MDFREPSPGERYGRAGTGALVVDVEEETEGKKGGVKAAGVSDRSDV